MRKLFLFLAVLARPFDMALIKIKEPYSFLIFEQIVRVTVFTCDIERVNTYTHHTIHTPHYTHTYITTFLFHLPLSSYAHRACRRVLEHRGCGRGFLSPLSFFLAQQFYHTWHSPRWLGKPRWAPHKNSTTSRPRDSDDIGTRREWEGLQSRRYVK